MALETLNDDASSGGWPSYVSSNLSLGNPGSFVNTAGGIPMPPVQGLNPGAPAPAPGMALPTGGAPPASMPLPPAPRIPSFQVPGAPSSSELTPAQKYQEALGQYEEILKKQSSLGSRMPWFQMAAGLLDPGKTGSFGESLGKASGAIAQHQLEQQKNAIPLAKARLELMQSGYGLARQVSAEKDFAKLLGGGSEGAPKIAAAGSGDYNPADPKAPDTLTRVGTKVDPTENLNATPINMSHVLAFTMAHPEAKEQILMLTKAAEMNQPDINLTPGGDFYNKKTGKIIGSTTALKQELTQTPFGDFNLTAQQYKQFLTLQSPEEQKKFLGTIAGTDDRGNPINASTRASAAETSKTLSTERAKAAVTEEQLMRKEAVTGMAILPVLDRAQALAAKIPKDKFGILGQGDVAQVMAGLMKPDSKGDMSTLITALRNAKASPEIINLFNDLDGQIAVAEAEYIAALGLGAQQSDFRVKFFQSIHPNSTKDMAGAFMAKINEFKGRYDWNVQKNTIYHEINKERAQKGLSPVLPDEFTTHPTYIERYNQYRKNYAEGAPVGFTTGPTTSASTAPAVPREPPTPAAIESRVGTAGYGPSAAGKAIVAPPTTTSLQDTLLEMKRKREAARTQTTP